jgi:hypothetical protein
MKKTVLWDDIIEHVGEWEIEEKKFDEIEKWI